MLRIDLKLTNAHIWHQEFCWDHTRKSSNLPEVVEEEPRFWLWLRKPKSGDTKGQPCMAKLSVLLYSLLSTTSQQLGRGCSGKQMWSNQDLCIVKLRGRFGKRTDTFCSCVFECHDPVWVSADSCYGWLSTMVIELHPQTFCWFKQWLGSLFG